MMLVNKYTNAQSYKLNDWRVDTRLIRLGLLLNFWLFSFIVYCQPGNLSINRTRFEQFPNDPNLSQNSINCIIQDHVGYLWVGTWAGLIRYNGYSTTVYHASSETGKLKSNQISTLYEDSRQNLWIGTIKGGLYRYNRDKNEFIEFASTEHSKSLVNNNIRAIQEDKDGNLWVGTEGGLSVMVKGDTTFYNFTTSLQTDSLPSNSITDLMLSSSGTMWIATGKGLCELIAGNTLEKSKFRTYTYTSDSKDYDFHNWVIRVNEFRNHGESTIWFATTKGLKRLHNGKVENFMPEAPTPGKSLILNILVGEYANPYLLLGTENGLVFFDPIKLTFKNFLNNDDTELNLSNNNITALYLDRGGVLWVGTKKGLNKYDTYLNDFNDIATSKFDHTGSIITGIQPSSGGGYWISTLGGGLFKYKDSRFEHFKFKKSERDEFASTIQSMFRDSRGQIWIGTAGSGVFTFHDNIPKGGIINEFRHFDDQSKQKISSNFVMSFAEDKIGNIWVGTWSDGLDRITPENRTESISKDLRGMPIVAMLVDHLGILWIGTRGNGLFSLAPFDKSKNALNHFKNEKQQHILTDNFITSLYEDDMGKLWIGTENGLKVFERQSATFSHVPIAGIDNDVVVSFLQDGQGRLWIANWDGLHVVNPSLPNDVKHYDHHDKIMGGFFYNNVCLKDQSDNLLFGGSEGLNLINPSKLIQSPVTPSASIEKFSIAHEEIVPGRSYDGNVILPKAVNDITDLTLNHSQNSIAFNFSALDFAAPEKTRYAYMLEGFDKDWIYVPSNNRIANYANLNPGIYSFHVKASTIDGRWSDKVSTVHIEILQPWWETIWAKILYGVGIVVILYLLRNYVLVRARVLHDYKVERIQRDNIEKLNQVKLQFFTNISHEFRTPLTLIIGPIQTMLSEMDVDSKYHNHVRLANENAQRLLRLINQLLDFRKVETENMKLSVAEGNIVQLTDEIVQSFKPLADENKISLSVQAPPSISLWFDRDKCEKILLNLISNALKHTRESGKIIISIQETDFDVTISVWNNGHGIKKDRLDDIFQPFFSFDEGRNHTSTGIGLALVKGLVELQGGSIRVESEENSFAHFLVTLKKGTAHFKLDELESAASPNQYAEVSPDNETEKTEDNEYTRHTKILIVDDNEDMRHYVSSIFDSGYQILSASDGIEGLSIAKDSIPDVVIADIMMPNLNGIEMCRDLKHDRRTSHIPVILLTARGSAEYKVEGLENGADEYVTKPFNPKLLQLKVRNLINRRDALHAYFNGHFTLEPKNVELSRDEQFIKTALELVEANIGNSSYTVEDMSKDVGMSHTQLYRKIKALTGQTINEFIRTVRLKRAAHLLEQHQLSVSEITYKVGFTDLQHFRECFKKMYGVTPSQYAQKVLASTDS